MAALAYAISKPADSVNVSPAKIMNTKKLTAGEGMHSKSTASGESYSSTRPRTAPGKYYSGF